MVGYFKSEHVTDIFSVSKRVRVLRKLFMHEHYKAIFISHIFGQFATQVKIASKSLYTWKWSYYSYEWVSECMCVFCVCNMS